MKQPTKTRLVKIVITKRADGKWDCVRERVTNGESATGLETLEDVFDYIRAHEVHETMSSLFNTEAPC